MDRKLSDSSLIISILKSYIMTGNDQSLDDVIEFYPEQTSIVKETGKEIITHPNMYKIMTPLNKGSSNMEQVIERLF